MPGPHPAVAATRSAVRACVADLVDDAPRAPLVLVACSGGADSLALAAAAAFEAARSRRRGPAGWRAGAVVVDHGLQPGSDEVADGAARACRGFGLAPVLVVRADLTGPGSARGTGGPEAAARHARYAALERAADEQGAAAVLLGHTLDDQAETVLLGLARGSGVRALAGMAPVRGRWRRPFLRLGRADTEQACAALGLEPWHDPTNGRGDAPAPGDLPLRSQLRTRVLPVLADVLGPGVPGALARTAELAAEAADVVDHLAADLLASAAAPGRDGADEARAGADEERVVLDVAVLAAALPGVRRRALALAAVRAGCPGGSLRREHVLQLDALVVDWAGQGPVDLPGARSGSRACGRLVLGAARTAGTTIDGSARGPG